VSVLRSLRNATKIASVVVNGAPIDKAALRKMLGGCRTGRQMAKKPGRYRLFLASGFASLAVPGMGCSPEAPVRPVANATPVPALAPCANAKPDHGLLCGRLSVPEDRSKPGGRRIELNVMAVPASATPRQPDPIFVFAGGPGEQATRAAPIWAGLPFERNRDLVFVDQRGTRGSGSLYCEDLDDPADIMMPRYHLPAVEACRDRLAGRADLAKYSTLTAVEDFDAVRQWLKYDRINVFGASYGSRVVLEYLRRHGDHARTAVVVAPVPPDFRRPLYYGRDGLAALHGIFAACRLDAACQRAFPDPQRQLEAVLRRLQRETAAVPWKHPKTGAAMTLQISRATFAEILWVYLQTERAARRLPAVIARASDGDFTALLEGAFNDGRLGVRDPIEGLYLSVTCSEETLRIAASDIGPHTPDFLGSDRLARQVAACRAWPRSSLPADVFEPVRTSVPTLIVTGTLDPITPTTWGRRLLEYMPNARLIDVPGMSHGMTEMDNFMTCLVGLNFSFWNAGTAEGLDTRCVATMKPPGFMFQR
jgi:pimeloyl-ACP methyl ester carboxylesterase